MTLHTAKGLEFPTVFLTGRTASSPTRAASTTVPNPRMAYVAHPRPRTAPTSPGRWCRGRPPTTPRPASSARCPTTSSTAGPRPTRSVSAPTSGATGRRAGSPDSAGRRNLSAANQSPPARCIAQRPRHRRVHQHRGGGRGRGRQGGRLDIDFGSDGNRLLLRYAGGKLLGRRP